MSLLLPVRSAGDVERLARDCVAAFDKQDQAALARLNQHYKQQRSPGDGRRPAALSDTATGSIQRFVLRR
jgi:hypothetical protein